VLAPAASMMRKNFENLTADPDALPPLRTVIRSLVFLDPSTSSSLG